MKASFPYQLYYRYQEQWPIESWGKMFSVLLLKHYVSISPNTLAVHVHILKNKMYTCCQHVPWLFWATTKLVLTI